MNWLILFGLMFLVQYAFARLGKRIFDQFDQEEKTQVADRNEVQVD